VIGGGYIFRGVAGGSVGMDRATADYMGMLADRDDALALGADTMRQEGMTARVMSAIGIEQVVEPYVRRGAAVSREGKVVDLRRRHRQPVFTTDTAAALRGAEIGAQIVLKATKVDGSTTADPRRSDARPAFDITFDEAIHEEPAVTRRDRVRAVPRPEAADPVFSIFKPAR